MDKGFYVTTPIYYVNDRPHIGHGYTTVAADVLARYHRLMGLDAFYLTGTDEHGTKVEQAAKKAGITPQQLVDRNAQYFKDAWKTLGVKNDYFVRTTDDRHEKAVQVLLEKLHKTRTPEGKTAIYESEYKGLYCVGCEKFLTEKDLTEDGLCPDHLVKPETLSERNYFFRLTSYLNQVKELIESDKLQILPRERKNETLGLFKQGLQDFSISREKVKWGVPLPFDPDQKAYVWVDALPNYISAIGFADDDKQFEKWWKNSRVVHVIGKDILKFHAVYWPAMLLAIGEKVPDTIFIHGYFTINGHKMSKSLGNVLTNEDLAGRFGQDATRYLLLNMFPFGIDGDIRIDDFYKRYNSDLANDIGNLISRTIKLTQKPFDGKVPPAGKPGEEEEQLQAKISGALDRLVNAAEALAPNSIAEAFMSVTRELNRYFDSQKPWVLLKENKQDRLATVLRTTLEGIRCLSAMAYPYLPNKCSELRKVLGVSTDVVSLDEARTLDGLEEGQAIELGEPLFPRLDIPKESELAKKAEPEDNLIAIDDFAKIDLRIADVVSAEPVPKADRLLKLQISIGGENRQIVAGIAEFYKPEDLVGRQVVVVYNLKPAKLRGIESQGMLLAARKGRTLSLLMPDKELPSGAKIS